jgi:hypothetical protein
MIGHGIVGERELDEVLADLEHAKGAQYISAFANLFVEMIAEVPAR